MNGLVRDRRYVEPCAGARVRGMLGLRNQISKAIFCGAPGENTSWSVL